jgi:hypothetical protein
MKLESNAWIVADRPERGYLYIGRADAKERAKVEPHPKGLKLTYDVARGRRFFSRTRVIPGQYCLNEVAQFLAYRTGWNHDYSTDQKNRINRFVRLRKGLLESKIWESRGKLEWSVPDWFFSTVRLTDFAKASSHSYRRWSTQMLYYYSTWTGFSKEAETKRRKPLFHTIPGARRFGAKVYEINAAFHCPAAWKTLLERRPSDACAMIIGRDWKLTNKAVRRIDEKYLDDEALLEFISPYGIGMFADVPHAEVRLAIALRSIWDRWNDGVWRECDDAAMPVPPNGWRWWLPKAKTDRYHQPVCQGVRRWIIRLREDVEVRIQIDYAHDAATDERYWKISACEWRLSPREIVTLEGFLGRIPGPFPQAKVQFRELAPIVRDRLAKKYKWAKTVAGEPETERYSREFRRITIDRTTGYASSATDECPF